MQIVIEIPDEDIPRNQEVVDIRLHFIDGHIVDANGYGFAELPKGHGRIVDMDEAIKCIDGAIWAIRIIIEADKESEDKE